MYADIGVIGVPRGQSMSPVFLRKSYAGALDTLYGPHVTNSGKQMRIFKLHDGFVVYAYTVGCAGNVFSDFNGRSGSYFGMAIVLKDNEFTNLNKIYQIFDSVYENNVKGNIVKDDGKNKRHLFRDFDDEKIQNFVRGAIVGQINKTLDKADVAPFKYNPNQSNRLLFNPPAMGVNVNSQPAPQANITKPKSNADNFDAAIEKLKQMGIEPAELAQYILNNNNTHS